MIRIFDIILLIVVYLIVLVIIAIAEFLRKRFKLGTTFTRRMIHLFAGDTILLLPFFSHWIYPFLIPVGLALLVGLAFAKAKESFLTKTMVEETDVILHAYGPVYYIVAIGVMVPLFWGLNGTLRYITMAATMIMAWGDGLSSYIPRILRSRGYRLHEIISKRTIEGSCSMFIGAFAGAIIALLIASHFGATPMTFSATQILLLALVSSIIATIAELLSVGPLRHFDNFTVPFSSAVCLYLLGRLLL